MFSRIMVSSLCQYKFVYICIYKILRKCLALLFIKFIGFQLIPLPYLTHNSMVLSRLFREYGKICATHPWEVIIISLTVMLSLVSVSAYPSPEIDKICGWNHVCENAEVRILLSLFPIDISVHVTV